jgi:hypothetical protein
MSDLATMMNAIADGLIRKHNLRGSDGVVVCWNCRGMAATMPTLHCTRCLALGPYGRRGASLGAPQPRRAPLPPALPDDGQERYP